MTKGFKDSRGKFHPTGNKGTSSRTKDVRTMGRESSGTVVELPQDVKSWFNFDLLGRANVFPRIDQWIDFHSPQDDADEWEIQEMWDEIPNDMRRDILFYYYEVVEPSADSGIPRPAWEEREEREQDKRNMLLEEFKGEDVREIDDGMGGGGIRIDFPKQRILTIISERGGASSEEVADVVTNRTEADRLHEEISVKLHLDELEKEGTIVLIKGEWIPTGKMTKEEIQEMKSNNPLDIGGVNG